MVITTARGGPRLAMSATETLMRTATEVIRAVGRAAVLDHNQLVTADVATC